jgi:hypothetical protein
LRLSPPISRFSSTESEGNNRRPSGTSAMPSFMTADAGRAPIGWPSNTMLSARPGSSPAIAFR